MQLGTDTSVALMHSLALMHVLPCRSVVKTRLRPKSLKHFPDHHKSALNWAFIISEKTHHLQTAAIVRSCH